MVYRLSYLVVVLAFVVFLSACSPPSTLKQETVAPVWPPAPEISRISWVKSFSRAEDVGIRRSFFQRLGDLLFGASDVALVRPMAVVTLGPTIYVADPGAKGVHLFNTETGDYRLIQGKDGAALSSPVGLARCGNEVLVSDSSLAQVFFLPAEKGEAQALTIDAALVQPTGIACDPVRKRLFISDTATHQIKVFHQETHTLTLEKTIGQRGAAQGEFNFPTYLWWSEGASGARLYVSDALNFRIQMFDAEGQSQGQFGKLGDGSGDAARQKGVATDTHGHVYVVDSLFHTFQIFDDQGHFLLSVGARGGEPGEFWLPTGIFIDRESIYVADSYNSRVQIFRYLGEAQ